MAIKRRFAAWRVTSITLVVVGLIAVAVSLWEAPASRIARQARLDHQRALAEAKSAVARSTVKSTPDTPVPTAWLPGQVAEATIPALGTQAPVFAEGTEGSALVIPQDEHQVGWDRQSGTAGAPGVTLLAGHVNWVGQGEGALGQIGQLAPVGPILVDLEGVRTVWRVVA